MRARPERRRPASGGSAQLDAYLKKVQAAVRRGDASERTHYPALQGLLESIEPHPKATVEPKRVQCGVPDFVVTKDPRTIGYVEAKDVGEDLDKWQKSDQLQRYLPALSNLILTDFLEFRWFTDGELRAKAKLGDADSHGKIIPDAAGMEQVARLLDDFMAHRVPSVGTPKELALRMARMAHMIRDIIIEVFRVEPKAGNLHSQYEAFKESLLPGLKPEEFADMYAQTIAYGLFAARVGWPDGKASFTRQNAAQHLPKTNPFLQKFFYEITGPDLDDRIAWLVDDLAQLLQDADMSEILKDFGRRLGKEDPVVHFYETFLAAYDPKLREVRGVYYTPEPVVSYIVRSIDLILKREFGYALGLADPKVMILDPACGTGTFLYAAIRLIHETVSREGRLGIWNDYVEKHLLPRVFGFELLMAPYTVAHLKLATLLKEFGYDFRSNQRLGVYLTNTLEEAAKKARVMFARFIAEESDAAGRIKSEKPIMVVLGNPPYSGHSANVSVRAVADPKTGKTRKELTWIGKLIEGYKTVDGGALGEKNPKWLQDDYVKFIRFAQWRIEESHGGIVGYVTNHGYLDNPTFRGMRQSLTKSFDRIFLLDLHGNAKKKETAPDGGPDKNVFDIQQGVAIGLFVKSGKPGQPGGVWHGDLWGERVAKYKALAAENSGSTEWAQLTPKSREYLFVPRSEVLQAEYEAGWKVTDIFPLNSVGIVTARDHLCIHWTPDEIWQTVQDFTALDPEAARLKYELGPDVRDWKVGLAQADVKDSGLAREKVAPVLYRPFDVRFTYYTGHSRGFICMPRREVMQHLLPSGGLGLVTVRRAPPNSACNYFFVTDAIISNGAIRSDNQSIDTVFPLYRNDSGEGQLGLGRSPNLAPDFAREVEKRLGKAARPEEIFHYIYAVFHSPAYRSRYAEFLKTDFPRVPLTSDRALFTTLVSKGAELVALHLMTSPALEKLMTKFPVKGTGEVEKVRYDEKAKRVYINAKQYFEGVPPDVWAFHVGGYQVCEKWLKDRAGRRLGHDDVQHYQKIVVALQETLRLMSEIDAAIPSWPLL